MKFEFETGAGVKPSEAKEPSYNGDYMALGKKAEQIVLDWLTAQPDVIDVLDLRENTWMQEAEADFMICLADGSECLAEIKGDSWLGVSSNVLFEILRINHTSVVAHAVKLGWTVRSEADVFYFYAPGPQAIYECKPNDLRAALQRYTREARKSSRFDYVPTDRIKSTVNVLIPWRYCERIFKVHKL